MSYEDLPCVTPEQVARIVDQNKGIWRNRIKPNEPRLGFTSHAQIAQWSEEIRNSTDAMTVVRRDRLRQRVDGLLHTRWLSHYLDHDDAKRTTLQPALGFPVPRYLPWQELIPYDILPANAREELWQRDVGDAMPAFALAAHLFPDIASICRERLKSFALAVLDFRTWGDQGNYTDMDLAVDHIGRGIAVGYDWHPEIWTESESDRLLAVLRGKLSSLLRGAYGDAFWAKGYADNHCQNAFAALGICGVEFLDRIPEACDWLGAAVAGFEYVAKSCRSDGSSAEGVPYWSYGMSFMSQYVELTKNVTGADWIYDTSHFKNSVSYRLHCSLSNLTGAAPFGDAPKQDYYGPSHILYSFARHHRDTTAQWLGDTIPFVEHGGPDVSAWALLWRDANLQPARPHEIPCDAHMPDWDVALTRSGWTDDDYVLAVKSGYTNRNHSHLDAGTVLLGWGDDWPIESPGYGKVGDGFWDVNGLRWKFYSNSTESHSTLLIDGKNQRFDRAARGTIDGFESKSETCWISVDLSGAYDVDAAIRRQVLHRRHKYILVLDEVNISDAGKPAVIEWLLQPERRSTIENNTSSVVIRVPAGAVTVRSLIAPDCFQPRVPQSERIDIPREAIRTLALSQKGCWAAFAILIAFEPAGKPEGAKSLPTASIDQWAPGSCAVRITGPDFEDILSSNERPLCKP